MYHHTSFVAYRHIYVVKQILCPYEDEEEQKEQEETERIDHEEIRIRQHPFENHEIKILYQEWHIGKS